MNDWVMRRRDRGTYSVYIRSQLDYALSNNTAMPVPVCNLVADEREGINQEETARLIEKAPDMLRCIEMMLNACTMVKGYKEVEKVIRYVKTGIYNDSDVI